MRVNSERGRTEYLLVGLVRGEQGIAAYPMGKGSGSVTAFSGADGFITIDQHTEIVDAGATVSVQLLGQKLEPADLVIIGSHCVGLDLLIGKLLQKGVRAKALFVGSMGGLAAAKRGECDIAGIHLMDPKTGEYNRHLLTEDLALVKGYGRMQGIVYRNGDARFAGKSVGEAVEAALRDPDCTMVNRNTGSGTRIIVDGLLRERRPSGYAVQTKSHNAVAAAVHQGRADWGVAINTIAGKYDLGFIPLQQEHYDFVVPKARLERPAVRKFCELLEDDAIRHHLRELGFAL
jgi:putative molybdopterin biosynthesis protein